MSDQPKKKLVLHIEVEGFNADDLDDLAAIWADGEPTTARERLYVVTEEWVRPDVGLTLVTIPGDKCMNDDFGVVAFNGRIVGAETRDADGARSRADATADLGEEAESVEEPPVILPLWAGPAGVLPNLLALRGVTNEFGVGVDDKVAVVRAADLFDR